MRPALNSKRNWKSITATPSRRTNVITGSAQPTLASGASQAVPCATPEGLILLKLYILPSLYRQGDLQRANLYEADVSALLLAKHPPMEPLFDELAPHVSASDLAELRKVAAEAQAREKRFGAVDPGLLSK